MNHSKDYRRGKTGKKEMMDYIKRLEKRLKFWELRGLKKWWKFWK
jgi:hypothetical protein